MSERTVAIIIGVSEYEEFEKLPAAEYDAIQFARSLLNWGIEEESIFLFINQSATKKKIFECFDKLAALTEPYKFVFYYSGHGSRSSPPNPKSYLMLFQSRLQLELLIRKTNNLNASEIYFFIDACELRINSLINPDLQMELEKRSGPRKSLFCILSSGIEKSFEDAQEEYGYFTESLLRSLSLIRRKDKSPDVLIDTIHADLKNQGLSIPEIYNIGTLKIDFFPDLPSGLTRKSLIAKIQDRLVQSPRKILCLIGEKGVGKTTLCNQIASEKCRIFRFDNLSSLEDLPPYPLILLDSIAMRKPSSLNNLMVVLSEIQAQFILVTNKSFKELLQSNFQEMIHEIEVPPLDFGAAEDLISQADQEDASISKELIFLITKGNPTKIKSVLSDSSPNIFTEMERKEIKKAIGAITGCGMYLNEELFCEVFQLNPKTLGVMEELGLITQSNHFWVPDECLIDIAEAEEIQIDHEIALTYWIREVEENPHEIQSLKSLILSIKCFGYEEKFDYYLERAFKILGEKGEDNIDFFEDGAEIFIEKGIISSASLCLADIYLEMGQLQKAKKLLDLENGPPELILQTRIKYAQYLWREGRFEESKVLSSQLASSIKSMPEKITSLLNRGTANFFLGEWKLAKADFIQVISETNDANFLGLGHCMLGSTLGFEGIDVQEGLFELEKGIRMLLHERQFSSAWFGFNNLGELYWMMGKYRSSSFYLQKALQAAYNPSMKIETKRNLLQLYLRSKGPESREVEELINEVESFREEEIEVYESMQLQNTLSFAYLLRGKGMKAQQIIQNHLSKTAHNSYLHLFALANLAYLFKVMGLKEKSEEVISKAIGIAKARENQLALDLIQRDWKMVENCLLNIQDQVDCERDLDFVLLE